MKKIIFFLIIISLLFLFYCLNKHGKEAKCFEKTYDSRDLNYFVFYIDSIDKDKCIYFIKSNWVVTEFQRLMYFDGKNIFVDFANENKFVVLASFKDSIGKKRIIKMKNFDFFNANKSQEYITLDYEVFVSGKYALHDENFIQIRIKDIIPIDKTIGYWDAVVFFSDKQGFVGSYLYNYKEPKLIIEKRGNILEEILDYSNFKSVKIL